MGDPAKASAKKKKCGGTCKSASWKVINAATMEITTVAVAGMVVTAAERVETSISFLTVQNAGAQILRKRKSVRRKENVASPRTWAMDVATMKTITVAAIGTMETAAGRVRININSRTARNASARIRKLWQNVPVTAENRP